MRDLGLPGFGEYLDYVKRDQEGLELAEMLDALSTNVTGFFRGADHLDYLRCQVLSVLLRERERSSRRIRMWSAGCSTGEEPYSMGIVVCQAIPEHRSWDVGILGTDLSTQALARAKMGIYGEQQLTSVAPGIRDTYFGPVDGNAAGRYRVTTPLRHLVTFARLNLMGAWPMRGPFDAIFCRNVMIYFDEPCRRRLVQRFWELLDPGGVLFIGHSETLAGVPHQFERVQQAVYCKAPEGG